MENEFERYISETEQKNVLSRIRTWAKFFFAFSICTGIFNLYNAYKLAKFFLNAPPVVSYEFKLQSFCNGFFLFFYGLMLPLQAYYYYRFIAELVQVDLHSGKDNFRASFNSLFKHALIVTILFGINTAWGATAMLISEVSN